MTVVPFMWDAYIGSCTATVLKGSFYSETSIINATYSGNSYCRGMT